MGPDVDFSKEPLLIFPLMTLLSESFNPPIYPSSIYLCLLAYNCPAHLGHNLLSGALICKKMIYLF